MTSGFVPYSPACAFCGHYEYDHATAAPHSCDIIVCECSGFCRRPPVNVDVQLPPGFRPGDMVFSNRSVHSMTVNGAQWGPLGGSKESLLAQADAHEERLDRASKESLLPWQTLALTHLAQAAAHDERGYLSDAELAERVERSGGASQSEHMENEDNWDRMEAAVLRLVDHADELARILACVMPAHRRQKKP